MKQSIDIRHIYTCMALTLLLVLMGSCTAEDMYSDSRPLPERALTVVPSIATGDESGIKGSTRAADTDEDVSAGDEVDGRDEYRENYFGSLDIFVKPHISAENTTWFKQYHLVAGEGETVLDPDRYDNTSLLNGARQLLSANWGTEGYNPNTEYDIYVSANNPHTMEGVAPTTLAGLKALDTFDAMIIRHQQTERDEHTDWPNSMVTDNDGEPKKFLMDGKIERWKVNPDKEQQEFEVDLQRAACKIVVNIKYDSENSTVLKQPENSTEPETDEQGKSIYIPLKDYLNYVNREPGVPRWKYVNFCRRVSDIADGTYVPDYNESGSSAAIHTWEYNFTESKTDASVDNVDGTYTITTYSYPMNWNEDHKKAPYILLSIAYTKKDNPEDMKLNYYRIPVCDESKVSSLERNNIYIVDVSIASLGADNASFELEDEQLRIEYHVIPWTDTNLSQEATTVKISDTKYFMVTPNHYTLKGNGTQSVDLNWYASVSSDDGRYMNIKNLVIEYEDYQRQDINITGTVRYTPQNGYNGSTDYVIESTASGRGTHNEKVTITIFKNGTLRVSSDVLHNRSMKSIHFTAYLEGTLMEQDIVIHHYPLDNLSNIQGVYASRSSSGWIQWDNLVGAANPSVPSTTNYRQSFTGTAPTYQDILEQTSTNQRTWSNTNNYVWSSKIYMNDQAGRDNCIRMFQVYGNYKQAVSSNSAQALRNRQMYVVQNTATSLNYAIGYAKLDNNYQSDDHTVSPAFMIASQLGATIALNVRKGNNYYRYQANNQYYRTLQDGGDYQSLDKLAAYHCGTYREVGTIDGGETYQVFDGWRLPTREEIGVIMKYQSNEETNGITIAEVLTGDYYWTLEGKAVRSGYGVANGQEMSQNSGNDFTGANGTGANIRCVRDLTLEEIRKLDGE